jgi:hypothetical protein
LTRTTSKPGLLGSPNRMATCGVAREGRLVRDVLWQLDRRILGICERWYQGGTRGQEPLRLPPLEAHMVFAHRLERYTGNEMTEPIPAKSKLGP